MRTTIDIEDDVLLAAKELARIQNVSAGRIVSNLLRSALSGQTTRNVSSPAPVIGGFRPFAARGVTVSNELINELRDQEGL